MKLREKIRVGTIQTTLDATAAWADTRNLRISALEEDRAIKEIGRGFADLYQNQLAPDIVILPELAVPRGFLKELENLAESIGAVVVAGLDYSAPDRSHAVKNEGVLIVPEYWGKRRSTFGRTTRFFGKTYPAERERQHIEERGLKFKGVPTVWVVNGGEIGKMAVCICYDLLDLSRLAMYRGQIQHLFVIAYNRDLTSFQHVAEAAARTIFCNVVVCNTGKFGGSLAIAPLHRITKRVVYENRGADLFDCQVFELQVADLARHQKVGGLDRNWKSPPPGYRVAWDLTPQRYTIKTGPAYRPLLKPSA